MPYGKLCKDGLSSYQKANLVAFAAPSRDEDFQVSKSRYDYKMMFNALDKAQATTFKAKSAIASRAIIGRR